MVNWKIGVFTLIERKLELENKIIQDKTTSSTPTSNLKSKINESIASIEPPATLESPKLTAPTLLK